MLRIYIVFLTFLLISSPAYAIQVPTEIISRNMLDGYMEYSSKENNRVFAISDTTGWGSSWGYASVEDATHAAMNSCGSAERCSVLCVNGVFQGAGIEEGVLRKNIDDAMTQILPQPSHNSVPKELIRFRGIHESYRAYLQHRGNKAFALANDGSWGQAHELSNIDNARRVALNECESATNQKGSCQIIDVNNQAVNGFETAKPAPTFNSPTVNEIPLSVNRFTTLQTYHDYLTKPGHRALFVSGGQASYRYNANSLEEAVKYAKADCESMAGRMAPCQLAAVDNRIEGESYAFGLVQYPTFSSGLEIPNNLQRFFENINYNEKNGHKALAVNNFGAYGFFHGYVNPSMARQDAMKMCETWIAIRKGNENFKGKNKPCHVIAENNTLIKENVDLVLAQSADSQNEHLSVGKPTAPWHGVYELIVPEISGLKTDTVSYRFQFGSKGFQILDEQSVISSGTYTKEGDLIKLKYQSGQVDPQKRNLVLAPKEEYLHYEESDALKFKKISIK
jgi:hypothetical protein